MHAWDILDRSVCRQRANSKGKKRGGWDSLLERCCGRSSAPSSAADRRSLSPLLVSPTASALTAAVGWTCNRTQLASPATQTIMHESIRLGGFPLLVRCLAQYSTPHRSMCWFVSLADFLPMSQAAASSSAAAAASAAESASTLGYRSSSSSSSSAPPSKKQKQQADDSGSAPTVAAAAASSSRVLPSKEDEIQAACADLARPPDPLLLMLQLLLNDQHVRSDARASNFPRELTQLVYDYATSTPLADQVDYVIDYRGTELCSDQMSSRLLLRQWIGERWPRVADYKVAPDSDKHSTSKPGDTCRTEHNCFGQWPGYKELLHAQLKPNETRLCCKELPGSFSVDPAAHAAFCDTTLQARKAAIVARGETPVPVSVRELHRRVGEQLRSDDELLLSSRLSPHPAHWRLLFHMAAWKQQDDNARLEREAEKELEEWAQDEGRNPMGEPDGDILFLPPGASLWEVVTAVRAKRQIDCGGWNMTREEILWNRATPPTDSRLVIPKAAVAPAAVSQV